MTEHWNYSSLSGIAEAFSREEIRTVSFDLFDTLVFRPLEHSEDVYELMDREYQKHTGAYISFRRLRTEAEALLRRKVIRKETTEEDFSLNRVYEVLVSEFGLSAELAGRMKEEEIRLECCLCTQRRSGKWLWEQAQAAGKKVIVVSDMILPADVLDRILTENGYENREKLYVSSEIGKRKMTGSLFEYISAESGLDPSAFFHIGDNLASDCRKAEQAGWHSAWLPNTIHAFDSRGCAHQVEKICRDLTDWEAAKRSVGISIFRKMAANYYFDDPFREFEESSDYNGDPQFLGYAALGPELLALVRWIADGIRRDGAGRIVFMARDGYLPMKAYDLYRRSHPELPPSQYLPVSRLAVLPAMIRAEQDLYDLPVDLNYQTPRRLLSLLAFCDREEGKAGDTGVFESDEVLDRDAYQRFIRFFIRGRYDRGKHQKAVSRIRNYLEKHLSGPVTGKTVFFDMGYSGRIPAVISRILEIRPAVYYFHADAREHYRYERRSGMELRTFFDFSPQMESTLREYSYLEPAPSCIGYTEGGEEILDEGPAEGYAENVRAMQSGAMAFLRDFLDSFSDYEKETMFRGHEAAMPFEAFIRHCSRFDRCIYDGVLMDDELWGGRRDIDLRYLIETRLKKLPDYAKDQEDE